MKDSTFNFLVWLFLILPIGAMFLVVGAPLHLALWSVVFSTFLYWLISSVLFGASEYLRKPQIIVTHEHYSTTYQQYIDITPPQRVDRAFERTFYSLEGFKITERAVERIR